MHSVVLLYRCQTVQITHRYKYHHRPVDPNAPLCTSNFIAYYDRHSGWSRGKALVHMYATVLYGDNNKQPIGYPSSACRARVTTIGYSGPQKLCNCLTVIHDNAIEHSFQGWSINWGRGEEFACSTNSSTLLSTSSVSAAKYNRRRKLGA